ncbi:ABC transporter substrate-binding protein [Pseudonocardia nematodicida]|uniref:ABC transporter substrate-binding protein n=1 Tax=Pseudonocardia nematodicida TaxID=1206997 RepID=A0ABV1KB83_9PSEU
MIRRRRATTTGIAALTVLLLSACGSTADTAAGGPGSDSLRTGTGVTDTTISLGVMTDRTGPFKNFGTAVTAGNQLWADDVNEAGGICGRRIAFESVDHGYQADTAKTLYPQLEPTVLGMVQLLGSPITAALSGNVVDDGMIAAAGSWSSEILDNPHLMVVGTTFDLEVVNGLSYFQQQGLIADGDTIGHIYIDGEYGGNGLRGSRYYAELRGQQVREVKITSTDTDLTNVVTGLRSDGVTAIVLSTSPGQTVSALAANTALGLDVPVLGNNPSFDPSILSAPAAGALDRLYIAASVAPFASATPKAREVAETFLGDPGGVEPAFGIHYGYAGGMVWGEVLRKACADGDLRREGVLSALRSLSSVSTDDLVTTLDYSSPGAPPTRGVYIARVDPGVPGGLQEVAQLFTAPDATTYRTPHQS